MVVWKITSDGAQFFAKRSEANRALREFRKESGDKKAGDGPTEIVIRKRDELAIALNDPAGLPKSLASSSE